MQSMPLPLQTPQKIIYLDYLRILACLGVFSCHLWVGGILPNIALINKTLVPECLGIHGDSLYRCGIDTLFLFPNNSWDHILFNCFNLIFGMGYQAVHLFFVLSGFGLALSALLTEKKGHQIRWFSFLKKRFFRLYPSYWLILAVYLLLNLSQYPSFLGLLKTYGKGAIFLDVLPATWYVPILLQLYLIFPGLFYCLQKLSLKRFLLLSLLVKIISSAGIITISLISFDRILGFGMGGLAPGSVSLTRLFEFSFGMAIAKYWVDQGCFVSTFHLFCKTPVIILGIFLECLGMFLSLNYSTVPFQGHDIPLGLFISDAFIGVAVFILALNIVFFVDKLLRNRRKEWLGLISNGTYEAYLSHGCLLGYFTVFLMEPSLKFIAPTGSYFMICSLYLFFLLMFSCLTLYLGCFLFSLKSYLIKKCSLLLNP